MPTIRVLSDSDVNVLKELIRREKLRTGSNKPSGSVNGLKLANGPVYLAKITGDEDEDEEASTSGATTTTTGSATTGTATTTTGTATTTTTTTTGIDYFIPAKNGDTPGDRLVSVFKVDRGADDSVTIEPLERPDGKPYTVRVFNYFEYDLDAEKYFSIIQDTSGQWIPMASVDGYFEGKLVQTLSPRLEECEPPSTAEVEEYDRGDDGLLSEPTGRIEEIVSSWRIDSSIPSGTRIAVKFHKGKWSPIWIDCEPEIACEDTSTTTTTGDEVTTTADSGGGTTGDTTGDTTGGTTGDTSGVTTTGTETTGGTTGGTTGDTTGGGGGTTTGGGGGTTTTGGGGTTGTTTGGIGTDPSGDFHHCCGVVGIAHDLAFVIQDKRDSNGQVVRSGSGTLTWDGTTGVRAWTGNVTITTINTQGNSTSKEWHIRFYCDTTNGMHRIEWRDPVTLSLTSADYLYVRDCDGGPGDSFAYAGIEGDGPWGVDDFVWMQLYIGNYPPPLY